jgi:uncharacterized OB-fold protein
MFEQFAPDPRPRIVSAGDQWVLAGCRCTSCGYALAFQGPRCPRCHGPVESAAFGPDGTVWASTVVHLELPELTPPYGLAYVDLDKGPRILVQTAVTDDRPTAIGSRVVLSAPTASGNATVEPARREL